MDMFRFANKSPALDVNPLDGILATIRNRLARGTQSHFHLEVYVPSAPSRAWIYDLGECNCVEQFCGLFYQETFA